MHRTQMVELSEALNTCVMLLITTYRVISLYVQAQGDQKPPLPSDITTIPMYLCIFKNKTSLKNKTKFKKYNLL